MFLEVIFLNVSQILSGSQKSTPHFLGPGSPLIHFEPLLIAKLHRDLPGLRLMLILGH